MFSQNDSWFMNESLAFYLSTSTFDNPLFETSLVEDNFESPEAERRNSNKHGGEGETAAVDRKPKPSCNKRSKQSAWSEFCGNLLFSIRSKMDVLELNFKRKLRRLRKFASGHGPTSVSHNGFRTNCSEPTRRSRRMNESPWLSTMDQCQTVVDKGPPSSYREKYWRKIGLSSSDSFGVQQEKILSRLRQAVEEKRSSSYTGQQKSQQLSNMNRGELCDGLAAGVVRFVGYPTTSDTTSLSSHHLSSLAAVRFACGGASYKVQNGSTLRPNKTRKNIWISAKRRTREAAYELNSGASKRLCIVCYTNPPNIVTLPCKHHEICSDCFIEIIYLAVKQSQYPLKCVLCRQKIERIGCSRKLLLRVIEKNRTQP